ncbi:OmpP1/FadL family transporter [Marinobacter zhejiangensis]|uniref:Long-chain fatty acid transport protein n=1 Tax=Marinobacter zhejiangensis TaxID=488535 RepID=A0A1I4LVN8_9GAMM|nr:outer membrane protein transport protein [Marinobacter zhejiangensis]SFL95050.1 long-chain fatty acid transport protein [Marinobacter zhejiangensis]
MFQRHLLAFGLLAITPVSALATNGYFQHGYGTISAGMGGTGTAFSQDSIAAATNPAGMAFVGSRLDGGLEVFSPRREYSVEGSNPTPPAGTLYLQPGTYESHRNGFLIPHFGYNRQVSDTVALGLTIYANGGMNTEYPDTNGGPFYDGHTGVNLEQVFIAPTWSWKFADNQAIGFSPVIAYQRFEAKGLGNFAAFSSDPTALTDRGVDDAWGYGFQIGWQGELTDTLRAGASWRSILEMDTFDKYKGLFAEQGAFDIPQLFNAGIAWSGLKNQWWLLEVQHLRFDEINSVGNPLLPNLMTAPLGDENGAGFGWDASTVVKLGWQWQQNEAQAWRAGASYGKQPIPDSEVLFNILAPGVQEWHFTAGFTRQVSTQLDLSGTLFYSPPKHVKGPNPLGPGQEIELTMYQLGAMASLGWSF